MSSKISALTDGVTADATDRIPVARSPFASGDNRYITPLELSTYIGAVGAPLTRTVAQMQALKAASGFQTGRSYIISNIQVADCTCSAMFKALSTSTISTTGNGTFLNAVMSVAVDARIEYTLATDLISSIYVPASNVLATSHFNLAAITSFPYDSATINDGVIHDPSSLNIHTNSLLVGFNLMGYNTISMTSGSTLKGVLGLETSLDLAGTATFVGTVGMLASVSMLGTQSLTNCTIGDGKTLDLTSIDSAYMAVGKVYVGNVSTFVCAQGKDLTGLTQLLLNDFLGGGEDFSFCGEFTGLTNGGFGGPFAIDTIQPTTIAHKFVLRHSSLVVAGAYVSGGNLRIASTYSPCAMALSSDAVGFTLDPISGDYITTGDTFIQ